MPEDEATIFNEKLSEIVDVPAPDSLIQGVCVPSEIRLSIGGKYKRGELLTSTGDNEFVSATPANLASAKEVCILCHDCDIPDGMTQFAAGYFAGTFNGEQVYLSYETESDDHDALISEVRLVLRRCAIYLV